MDRLYIPRVQRTSVSVRAAFVDMITLYMRQLLADYNILFDDIGVSQCACYAKYASPDGALQPLLESRDHYMACMYVTGAGRTVVAHLALPIMLGSKIDFTLRRASAYASRESESNERTLYGHFIIGGELKYVPNFLTNNVRTLHPYSKKCSLNADVVFKGSFAIDDAYKVYISFHAKQGLTVTYTRNKDWGGGGRDGCDATVAKATVGEHVREATVHDAHGEEHRVVVKTRNIPLKDVDKLPDWADVINDKAPVELPRPPTAAQLLAYFAAETRNKCAVDALWNKVVITAVELLRRMIARRKETDPTKRAAHIASAMRSGNGYYALSTKNIRTATATNDAAGEYPSVFHNVDPFKIDKGMFHMHWVNRSAKQTGLKGMRFPVDAEWFLDPQVVKEMKGAGNLMALSSLVIVPPAISTAAEASRVLECLRQSPFVPTSCCANDLQVLWNGFLTGESIRADVSTSDVALYLKRHVHPYIHVARLNDACYLSVYTDGNVPLVYSARYDVFLSAFEAAYVFPDPFCGIHPHFKLSVFNMRLSPSFPMHEAKAATVVTNVKGAAVVYHSTLIDALLATKSGHVVVLKNYSKTRCALSVRRPLAAGERIPESVRSTIMRVADEFRRIKGADPETLHPVERVLQTRLLRENDDDALSDAGGISFESVQRELASRSEFDVCRMFDQFGKRFCRDTCSSLDDVAYNDTVRPDAKFVHSNQVVLYTTFGEAAGYIGSTEEDAVCVDASVPEHIQKQIIFKCNLVFTRVTAGGHAPIRYIPFNVAHGQVVVFGQVACNDRLTFTRPKKVNVKVTLVGADGYLYTIFIKNHLPPFTHIASAVRPHVVNGARTHVTCMVTFERPVGVDSKLATSGQKCVASSVIPAARRETFYSLDGRHVVHPQVRLSLLSLFSRTQTSTVLNMLTSKDVAFSATGCFTAPLPYNVQSVDAVSYFTTGAMKIDTMAQELGMTGNSLGYFFSNIVSDERQVPGKLHIARQIYRVCGIDIHFLTRDDVHAIERHKRRRRDSDTQRDSSSR